MSTFHSSRFQFHKVRLKDLHEIVSLTAVGFQFHKVRLKDTANVTAKTNVFISIP